MFVGDETEPAAWEAAVLSALGAPWVVQERVSIPEEPFPVFDDGALAFASLEGQHQPVLRARARARGP